MSTTRSFLLVALAFVAFLNWEAWQKDYAPQPATTSTTSATPAAPTSTSSAEVPKPAGTAAPAAATISPTPSATTDAQPSARVHVRTDVLDLAIDTRGGSVVQADLLKYPVDPKEKDHPVRLLDTSPATFFVAQDGLVSATVAPDHLAQFTSEKDYYALGDGTDKLEVPLEWQDASGLKVRKVYIFTRGQYLIDTRVEINNGTQAAWTGNEYRQLQRVPPIVSTSGFSFNNPERIAFAGAAWYSPQDKFKKLPFDKFSDSPLNSSFAGGWEAMLQHYFFAAWIPPTEENDSYATTLVTNAGAPHYLIRAMSPAITVAPGETKTSEAHLYIGPKLAAQLDPIDKDGIAHGLGLTADYGWLTPIANPLHWVLVQLHSFVGNWGLAIILLVLIIKLAMFKLSEAQYRSMAKMRKLQPRMEALKERYGDDRQKLSQATMELYKKEKINPLGGCLPTLIQIPVFFALYYMLLESVELRQAPFFGWIQNLSAPDPYYVLPVINALIMLGAQWLTPASPGMDPLQQRLMKTMPLIFAVLFLFFPAGLVLYYAVNGGLGLLQQWIITRRFAAAERPA
ncbi:MAG TPA: membrane protein insertase YidC [Rudaea sp.]|jgi:YidC/Oxa1 family membrane protein insertase|nr:membrane protein insertase YidC [Rudaea sp.]